jgi:hypothetical protein
MLSIKTKVTPIIINTTEAYNDNFRSNYMTSLLNIPAGTTKGHSGNSTHVLEEDRY